MGVIYKLRDEVVHFIISQRQGNPLSSCRQLAESASQKFGLQLSKSSVHDVLKESGIITPRGRKPRPKFEIPQEKKKQIQSSLSEVKLLPDLIGARPAILLDAPVILPDSSVILSEAKDLKEPKDPSANNCECRSIRPPPQNEAEISAEYEGAGKIFLKAALWDLGIFSEESIKATDRAYYLTYTKGIKVALENSKEFFIDLPLPIERCIREAADGLINNIRPLVVPKVSDKILFKACMEAQEGFKINKVSIVDQNDHILLELDNILEFKREYSLENVVFVESSEISVPDRAKALFFFSHSLESDNSSEFNIDNISNLKGFDTVNKNENIVTLLVEDSYSNLSMLKEAADRLNGMYLRDEQGRLLKVVILSEAKDLKKS